MEPEGPVPYLQESITHPHTKLNVVSHAKPVYLRSLISLFHLCLGFLSGLFPSCFHISILYVSSCCDAHPIHLILILIFEGEPTMCHIVGIQLLTDTDATFWLSRMSCW